MTQLPNPYESPKEPNRRPVDESDDKSDLLDDDPPLIGYKVQVTLFAITCVCSIIAATYLFGRNGAAVSLFIVCMLIAAARRK